MIIMVCACREGIGGSHFEELIMGGNPQEIDRKLSAVPPRETIRSSGAPRFTPEFCKRIR